MFNRDSLTPIFSDRDSPLAAEWRSLSRERDSELFGEAVLALADRAAAAGDPVAARIYASASPDDDAISRRAGERLAALQGEGGFGGRAETLLRDTVRQAVDPTLLFGMCAAGSLFRMTRLTALSHFAAFSTPASRFAWLGQRVSANLLAFGVEALSFPLATRLSGIALGRRHESGALSDPIAASFLMLGALRFSGALGRRFGGESALASQAAMLGGIMLGQFGEQLAGLRAPGNFRLSEAFATLLQFNIAARVSHRLMPEGWQRWERDLDARHAGLAAAPGYTEALNLREWQTLAPGLRTAAATAGPIERPRHLMMASRLEDNVATGENTPLSSPRTAAAPKASDLPVIEPREDSRPRRVGPFLRLMKAHGVYWLVDTNSEGPPRDSEARVGEELLPQRGSLRVHHGDVIRIGEESFIFSDPLEALDPGISESIPGSGEIASPSARAGGEFFDHWGIGEEKIVRGVSGREIRLQLRAGRTLEPPRGDERIAQEYELQVDSGTESAAFRIVWRESEIEVRHHEFRNLPPDASFVFLEWLARQAAIRASRLTVRAVNPQLVGLLENGLIHSRYAFVETRQFDGKERRLLMATAPLSGISLRDLQAAPRQEFDLSAEPDPTLVPRDLGRQYQAAAARAFDRWMRAKLGIRLPSLVEIEAGEPLPVINRMRTAHSMNRILSQLIQRKSRFLEIGYGERTETLEAVARRGGISHGLERDGVFPPDAKRETLETGPVDVLFINGSPFLFYANHVVTLPAALDVLKHASRTRWLLIQSYNPRTPFEMLRHAENIHRLNFEVMYYRATPSRDVEPVFPTDHGERSNTYNAVLIARRSKA